MNISANGLIRSIQFDPPPNRVVSLVPSLTESIFELGLGDMLVGVTDYCVKPAEKTEVLPKVGGTKNPDFYRIIELKPELVLANQEENSQKIVEQLEAAGIHVWVTFPKTVRDALDVLWTIAGVYHDKTAVLRLEVLERSVDWAESSLTIDPKFDYFCPIWQGETTTGITWWMTFNEDTYAHDVLRLFGGKNIFAGRGRAYPLESDLGLIEPEPSGERDTRYPRVSAKEIRDRNPQIILLPNEPFYFQDNHKTMILRQFGGTNAVRSGQVHLLDGSLLTWHGTRLARALKELPEIFASI